MTIDVYPAKLVKQTFDHADNWDDGSTMNMANGNFYGFFYELMGKHNVPDTPGHWKTKFVADSLRLNTKPLPTHYVARLTRIVAQAEVLKAEYICYS